MRLKYVFQGIAVSACGASVWLFLYLLRMYHGSDRYLVVALCTIFGLLMASIYIVPLGAVLGMVVPFFCLGSSVLLSGFAAAAIGGLVAALTSLLVAVFFELNLGSVFRSMWPLCVALILGWALLARRSTAARDRAVHLAGSPEFRG